MVKTCHSCTNFFILENFYQIVEDCKPEDSDFCLQTALKNLTDPKDTTSCPKIALEEKCDTLEKDTLRCCPVACKKGSLTEKQCNELISAGNCNYPNEAQCTGNFDQTNNNTIE